MIYRERSIQYSGDEALIKRVRDHIGEEALSLTADQVAHYLDGGQYGGPPDPRSLAGFRQSGQFTSQGSQSPKKML